jgi:DUF4097 and DUF4098 domain-containing protein YvlB
MTRTAVLAGLVALALGRFGPDGTVQRPIDLEAADCSTIHQTFGEDRVARATRHQVVPIGAGPLDVRPEANGGVRIERGGGGEYGITACIAAGAATLADAQAVADAIALDVSGARVRVRDAASRAARSVSVQLIVTAPDGAEITAETSNGPLGARDFTGTLDLRASNGPISLTNVGGEIKAHAANGPISIHGGSGTVDVETANGPIDVRLEGRRWDGHLTAHAGNGPLTVSVPADYQSGVEVRSSSRAPWSCRAAVCGTRAGRDWDDSSRVLRIGADPALVFLSTDNGPVTVRDR